MPAPRQLPPTLLRRKSHFQDARTRVAVFRMPRQAPMEQHRHEFIEVAVVLSGSGEHVTEGFRHELQAGDVLVISRQRAHGYENTRALNLVNVLFREDLLPRIARELGGLPGYHALFAADREQRRRAGYISRVRLTAGELAQIEDWIARLEAETHERQPGHGGHLLAEAYLTLIIGVLSRRQGRARRGGAVSGSAGGATLGRVLNWLEKNLGDPGLRVEDLARVAGMSPRNFHRVFREAMGGSPADYVLRRRLQRAAELLRQPAPRLRIGEVAAGCGFGDSNYFTRMFRREFGMCPRAWRDQG